MALDNVRDFLGALDARGELVRVDRPVSVDKEITEIADRCMKSGDGGPALPFERPTLLSGAPARRPCAVQLRGLKRRIALALGGSCRAGIGARNATLIALKLHV